MHVNRHLTGVAIIPSDEAWDENLPGQVNLTYVEARELRDKLDAALRAHIREPHITDSNPTGTVRQCDRRDLHEPHEYQAEFGAYFNVYCPGNDGKSP